MVLTYTVEIILLALEREDLLCFWAMSIVISMSMLSYLDVFYVIKQNNPKSERTNLCMVCCGSWVKHFQDVQFKNVNEKMSKHNHDTSQSMSNILAFKQAIQNMRHWSHIVSTSMGYKMFINHLEKEFSVETMLFITEVCYTNNRFSIGHAQCHGQH